MIFVRYQFVYVLLQLYLDLPVIARSLCLCVWSSTIPFWICRYWHGISISLRTISLLLSVWFISVSTQYLHKFSGDSACITIDLALLWTGEGERIFLDFNKQISHCRRWQVKHCKSDLNFDKLQNCSPQQHMYCQYLLYQYLYGIISMYILARYLCIWQHWYGIDISLLTIPLCVSLLKCVTTDIQ